MLVQEINKSFIRPHKMCIPRFKAVNQNILSRAEPVRHGHKIRPVRRFLDGHPPFQRRQIHDLLPELLVFCDRQIQLGQYAAEIMMGQESNGMLLSAEKDEKLNLLMLDDSIPAGAKLC